MNLQELRLLVRRLVNEYVANDGNPHKDAHADPTGKAWDAGLDEADDMSDVTDWEKGYYVVFDKDIHVVGPRRISSTALRPGEEFMAGPFEMKANAEREADKKRNLARSGETKAGPGHILNRRDLDDDEVDDQWNFIRSVAGRPGAAGRKAH